METWKIYTLIVSGDNEFGYDIDAEEYVETVVTPNIERYLEDMCDTEVFGYMFENSDTIVVYEIDWEADEQTGMGLPVYHLHRV